MAKEVVKRCIIQMSEQTVAQWVKSTASTAHSFIKNGTSVETFTVFTCAQLGCVCLCSVFQLTKVHGPKPFEFNNS